MRGKGACIHCHSYNDDTTPRNLDKNKCTGSVEALSKLNKLKYMCVWAGIGGSAYVYLFVTLRCINARAVSFGDFDKVNITTTKSPHIMMAPHAGF